MKIEDIKVGETYNVRVVVTKIDETLIYTKTGIPHLLDGNCFMAVEAAAFSHIPTGYEQPINLLKMTEIPETYPKHDPCRKFRKGDKVRVVRWNGRDIARVGQIGYVVADEYNSRVELAIDGWTKDVFYPACHLELVTPVEELEPYYVSTNIDCSTCTIFKRVGEKKFVHSAYYFVNGRGCSNAILGINEANAAAEAECARLNAEYRKEQK